MSLVLVSIPVPWDNKHLLGKSSGAKEVDEGRDPQDTYLDSTKRNHSL